MPTLNWLKLGKWAAVIAIAIAIWSHGFANGNDSGEVEVAELKAKHADVLLTIANASKRVAELTRFAEHALADDLEKIDIQHQEALRHASQSTRDAVLADLRAGRVRVRVEPSRCPMPASDAIAAPSGIGHGTADDGSGDAGDLAIARQFGINVAVADTVGVGARADERLSACQSVIRAYRAASDTGFDQPPGERGVQ